MKVNADSETDNRMHRYIERVEKRLYKLCFNRHWLPTSEQLVGLVELLRWIKQFGICGVKTGDPPPLNDSMAKLLASELIKAIDENDFPGAVMSSIRLGYLVSRVRFGRDYLEAQRGMNVMAGARKGAVRRHNINSIELKKRNQAIRAFVTRRMREDLELTYKSAMYEAAKKFSLSFESIKNISKNPRPRGRRTK